MLKELFFNIFSAFLGFSSLLIGFLTFNGYSLLAPESMLFFGVFLAIAVVLGLLSSYGGKFFKIGVAALLVTLLIDYQFPDLIQKGGSVSSAVNLAAVYVALFLLAWSIHRSISQVMLSVFATIILTTLLIPSEKGLPDFSQASDGPDNKDLPLVLHIVLDEHIGIEGIPTSINGGRETKDLLKDFYLSQGFTLFGKAFSSYQATRLSLGSLVSLGKSPAGENVKATNQKRGGWGGAFKIQENPYFDLLKKSGYRLNVYQNDFLDFCSNSSKSISTCVTYACCSIGGVAPLPMSAVKKMRIQASTFLELFVTYKAVRKVYRYLFHMGLPIPYWEWERQFNAISGYNVLNRLKSDISQAAKGRFYFAHALLPHFPYVYDRECNVNPPDKWLSRFSERAIEIDRWRSVQENIKNTPETRAERYSLYFEQALCAKKFMGEIFQRLKKMGLYDEAVIIIHGDHGSRLPLRAPDTSRGAPLSTEDIIDSYSTLFAIKAPGIAPGYDLRRLSIQALVEDIVKNDAWTLSNDGRVEKASAKPLIKDSAGPAREMVDFGEDVNSKP